jgi:lysophospholipase L1-like esterase
MKLNSLSELLEPNRPSDDTPAEVEITREARKPELDPTLGIPVTVARGGEPRHRLVTLGDSLTQGFQSLAVSNTHLSWPHMVAWELGWAEHFRYPMYWGEGGMPLNIELIVRTLERRFGPKLDGAWEKARAAGEVLGLVRRISEHWKREWDRDIPLSTNHNLAVWGWDLRDVLERTAATCSADVARCPDDYFDTANARSGYRVLAGARDGARALTALQAARQLSEDGRDEAGNGIETLVVMLGSNNSLRSVVNLRVVWSGEGFDDLNAKQRYTVWRPSHFRVELERVLSFVETIRARHVILSTVPHVTIPPISRGISRKPGKVTPGSRYFEYYTRPWISPDEFDPHQDRCITAAQARAVDSAIDQYNRELTHIVRLKRRAGQDYYLFDLAGLLDRLAHRRYLNDAAALPSWWQEVGGEYELPAELAAVRPKLSSHLFQAGANGREQGGLFSLDHVHPTTVGYGIIAQEIMGVMQRAGVVFRHSNGVERPGSVQIDFTRLLRLDSLLASPPQSLNNNAMLCAEIDRCVDGLFDRFGVQAPRF